MNRATHRDRVRLICFAALGFTKALCISTLDTTQMITGDSNPDKEVESIAHRLGCVLILAVSSGVEEHTTQGVLISPLAVGTHSNRSGPGTGSKCPPMGQSGHDLHLEQGLGWVCSFTCG